MRNAPPGRYSTTRRVPSAGSTPAARTSCAVQRVSSIPVRTVPGAGVIARAVKSTRPHGHGAVGR